MHLVVIVVPVCSKPIAFSTDRDKAFAPLGDFVQIEITGSVPNGSPGNGSHSTGFHLING